ncbi:Ribosome-recycling factor [Planctomycetes bacterium Pan216]|uniref:Ribosome-recycling factor n=1 Tax=Kolteria novifilia TaxID=2527975 RepID=A0A518B077_9BACT|nr:Ribosome-recycling factor [Planctomycetes bacterium Pan216]
MDSDEIQLDAEERMQKAVDYFRDELVGIRTGRASPGLVESVRVDYYGSPTPLKQIASVSAPEAQLLVIRPFDANALKEIEKAILASDLGLTPNNDGKVIRLNVPSLSGEQRKRLASRVRDLAEEAKVAIRNIRRDGNKNADAAEKSKEMSEDDRDQLKDEIQKLTKEYEKNVSDLAERKTAEVME